MALYVNAYGKYVLAILLILYTSLIYVGFWKSSKTFHSVICGFQTFLVFLYHGLAFLCIYVKMDSFDYIVFYLFQLLILFTYTILFLVIYPGISHTLLNNTCMLLAISMIILTRLNFDRAKRQCFMIIVSAVLALFIPFVVRKLKGTARFELAYGVIGVAALASVYLLGTYTGGSKLYLQILGFNLQVSEFVKILFVVMLAGMLSKRNDFPGVVLAGIFAGMHIMILVFSKDLGSALLLYMVFVLMVFVGSGKWLYLPLGAMVLAGASYIAYFHFTHFRVRVRAFMNPWDVIDNEGYQITQSLFAISGGGLFGMGLFRGTSKNIPNVMTDFIFSAITEELGLLTAVCIILIYFGTFLLTVRLAISLKNMYEKLIAFGLGFSFIMQVFIIIGGDTRFIPMTGITLPLMSYGGNSVMATMFLFSMLQGLHLYKRDHREDTVSLQDKISLQENSSAQRGPAKENDLNDQKPMVSYGKVLTRFRHQNIGVTLGVLTIFIAMSSYIVWYATTNEQALMENDYNAREKILEQENIRGTIYSAEGEKLAYTDEEEQRIYPYGDKYAHVVGYTGYGMSGLEDAMNYFLISSDLTESEKLEYARKEEKYPGNDVTTTLQTSIQEVAWKALGAYKGAVIVSDPTTGAILAMVSKPSFDPNEIAAIWEDITEDEDNSVLLNRVTQGTYPPGSTFKILTALEYMRENPEDYKSYTYQCNGSFHLEDTTIHCYHGMSHGAVDFEKSFAKSCNSSFANIGSSLDWNRFGETLQSLLFNSDLPYDLPYTHSKVSAYADLDTYTRLQTAIGQSTTCITPLHLNLITCTIANDGILMKPRLVSSVHTAGGALVKAFPSETAGTLMTAEEAENLTELMKAVVESGTATKISGQSYTAAGKTGSAEYNNDADSHAWFTGFAPADDPKYCVTVIVEGGGSGGDYAVPIARRIFDVCLE
ncbi:MAG: FtsW/RodA/SpoVE family cell cycle protein [Lachnospiraceae bacterium]|nr:FtsW/RodA/SpoVE family cell cycle protein [Lachnospiraceae bacterium]